MSVVREHDNWPVFSHTYTLDSVACAQCVLGDTTDGEPIIPLSLRAYILEFH